MRKLRQMLVLLLVIGLFAFSAVAYAGPIEKPVFAQSISNEEPLFVESGPIEKPVFTCGPIEKPVFTRGPIEKPVR